MVGGTLHGTPVVHGVDERLVERVAVRAVDRHDHRRVGAGLAVERQVSGNGSAFAARRPLP